MFNGLGKQLSEVLKYYLNANSQQEIEKLSFGTCIQSTRSYCRSLVVESYSLFLTMP